MPIWLVSGHGVRPELDLPTKFTFLATYTLIYDFLRKQSHSKAADALRKEAKAVVTLKDANTEGPALDEIIKQWKKSKKSDTLCV